MNKTPVMMSALVCPGIGQFMQGRKTAGTLFLVLILVSFAALMVFAVEILVAYYRLGFDLSSDPGNIEIRLIGLVASFAASMIIYVISLIDTVCAARTPPPLPR
jgi:hypothetical protein